ncbi:MAG: molybdopterin-binding protein [Acidobacteria bacterium]|nr:MAG: molybdopterin-binding protein [Acidobacteriota bacterium]REK06869.1 MAG: molybdopterin-binding protein [Acidobacteriota bacterium]
MRFGAVPLAEAVGHVLAHNVVDGGGRRVLRKGRELSADDVETLRRLGRDEVTVARLEPGDVGEDEAADRITRHVAAGSVRRAGPSTGRVNLHAIELGVLRIDPRRLLELNSCPGVTLATLRDWTVVRPDRMVGTTKILPYALEAEVLEQALAVPAPILEVEPLPRRRAHLVVTAGAGSREKTLAGFEKALRQRLEALGSSLVASCTVSSDVGGEEELASALAAAKQAGAELVVVAGETAIQDRHDTAPRALERAGGEVTCYGAPVDPGNLLLLGALGEVPVLGAPGCARSPKRNIVDLLLPRLLLGHPVSRLEVLELGHGGLLEDVPERPLPRREIEREDR